MVGIVIVSHSAKLAEGIVELASQMSGPDVQIRAAGGVDFDPNVLGTDPNKVLSAIEAVYSEDGVFVLMDLGSALLSAEMALEMLPAEHRPHVLLSAAPIVEGAVAAAACARIGGSLDEVVSEARGALDAKMEHLASSLFAPANAADAVQTAKEPAAEEPTHDLFTDALHLDSVELQITINNRLGLHARPVARFVQTAARFADTDVRVSNLTTGKGPANARSINALATLGVRRGHEILIRVTGAHANAALQAIQQLAADNFGDDNLSAADQTPEWQRTYAVSADSQEDIISSGIMLAALPVSAGIAIGPARLVRLFTPEIESRTVLDPEVEWKRFLTSVLATQQQISHSRQQALRSNHPKSAEIFDAHLLFLEDEALLEPTQRTITTHRVNAESAWMEAVREMAARYRQLDDDYLRVRAADVEDVGRQVLFHLMGTTPQAILLDQPGILIADDLAPSETSRLDPALVQAIALAAGGTTSHSAILARSLGIPAVAGLGHRILEVAEGTQLVLDGSTGQLWIDPSEEVLSHQRKRAASESAEKQAMLASSRHLATTLDGRRIEVAANIGGTADARAAIKAGAESAGLFRTEFLFLDRQTAPSEEEQYLVYHATAEAMQGHPMIVRTLDAGGDKPISYLNLSHEENPFLGYRAIRLCLDQPELFKTQLRAIVRVAVDFPLKIMFPMIATVQEWRRSQAFLTEVLGELWAKGLVVPGHIETGMMVEVPSAAVMAAQFAPEVDFFSIGTNDLTQYTLAAERGNPRLAYLNDALHPAVLTLIDRVVEAAHAHGKWVGICGELGGDPLAVPILVGLGVDELSMGAPAIPRAKQIIRGVDYASMRTKVRKLLTLESAEAVRKAAAALLG